MVLLLTLQKTGIVYHLRRVKVSHPAADQSEHSGADESEPLKRSILFECCDGFFCKKDHGEQTDRYAQGKKDLQIVRRGGQQATHQQGTWHLPQHGGQVHLCEDRPGLAVPDGDPGPVQSKSDRLVTKRGHDGREHHHCRLENGRWEQASLRDTDIPFRQGRSICLS